MQLPEEIKNYLNERKITDAVISTARLTWNGNEIVIPIFSYDGDTILFNKYRRNPNVYEGPKYRYERGASAQLYTIDFNPAYPTTQQYILEGEFDVLAMKSQAAYKQSHVFSSTGGCKTFKKEWIERFNKPLIVYDYDESGIEGAFRVHALIPGSSVCWFPEVGMDATDWFKKGNDSLPIQAFQYLVPPEKEPVFKFKKNIEERINLYLDQLVKLFTEERDRNQHRESTLHITILRKLIENRVEELREQKSMFKKKKPTEGKYLSLQEAKEIPIYNFIKFNRDKFAPCIWHTENTPSLKYYPDQNKCHCFGCGKGGDVIDVVMQLNTCDIKEALKILLN